MITLIDISHWQGEMNPSKALAAGAQGAYIKAGGVNWIYGSHYTDVKFEENAAKFAPIMPVGYYWFFHPQWPGKSQAEYFCDLLMKHPYHLPPVVDVESNNTDVSTAKYQDELKAFLDRTWQLVRQQCVIYTRASFWNPNVGNPAWASAYRLWVARYTETLEHPWEDAAKYPWVKPSSWDDFWMWQWSADYNNMGSIYGAESNDIDLNRLMLTTDEYKDLTKWGNEEPTPEEPGCAAVLDTVITALQKLVDKCKA